ncbi:UV radiation resistance protein and autophagy-related subunit 14-domain-containing protein [Schizophyllum amplum]|uniref:Autophagy-related protein 14 n=1 Tax=Schizophyllum amplum TaxID=97359 RepID=A0A550CBW4_9AGAR|nr:UV radiation resistance protein and autophagy-related subunit 14-domain-containing protein [Auriculariopsis ampla]
MDCANCELKQRQFHCARCLNNDVRKFRNETQKHAAERDVAVAAASSALEWIKPSRARRAEAASHQARVSELNETLQWTRRENQQKRDRIQALRETIASRRLMLIAARLVPSPTADNEHLLLNETQELASLASAIRGARAGLVQELVEVFNIVQVGGRPSIGGKAGTKGEWTIGDLILPVPGDIRRYPPDHINAVMTHIVHFLTLLTFYLGVKMPFDVTWTGGKLGVGQPMIGAIRGGESGGWARWYTKHSLHVSANPAPSSQQAFSPPSKAASSSKASSSSPKPSSSSPKASSATNPSQPTSPSTDSAMADSIYDSAAPPVASSSFTTALTMLLYDVVYLAHTQNVAVPLNQAGDMLSNLWSICCSGELGRASHAATPRLPPPTPSSFPVDFAKLLQVTSVSPRARASSDTRSAGGDGAASPKGRNPTSDSRHSHTSRHRQRQPRIEEEEEDGWDLLEGDEDM